MNQQFLRNGIHLATGLAAPVVVLAPAPWPLALLLAMLTVAVAADAWRLTRGPAVLDRLLPGVFRHPEPMGVSGATLLAVGYLLAFLIFPPPAAAAGITALAVGDPAAAVAGRYYGARRGGRGGKTWVGSVACFLVCVPILLLVPGFGLAAAAAGGAMAALVERRAGGLDNVLIPVSVAMLMNLWVP